MTGVPTNDQPSLAFSAVVPHAAESVEGGLVRALMMDVMLWNHASRPLLSPDYQVEYEAGGGEFFLTALLRTITFYQALHSVLAGAVVLARSCADPPISKTESLGEFQTLLSLSSDQELRARFSAIRSETEMLQWLAKVRNKAIQHRAGNAHYSSDGIILRDGLAFVRRHQPMDDESMGPPREELERLNRKYGLTLDTHGTSEVFAYLDLVSQQLYGGANDEYDRVRQLVEGARLYQVVMSQQLIENVDAALAALFRALPVERTRLIRQ
jgi:hypothetical protein